MSPALTTFLVTPLLGLAVPLDHVVYLAIALFAVGLLGVTTRRNILIVLLSVEIMLNSANLALVAFSRVHGNLAGQVFVFFSMTVAAAEVAVGLAIVIALYRLRQSTDIEDFHELGDVDYGPLSVLKLEGEAPPHEDGHHSDENDDGGHPDDTHPDDSGADDTLESTAVETEA